MIQGSDLKKGMIINTDGALFSVVDTSFNFQGRGSSMVQAKLKNLETGSITNNRFGTSDKIEDVQLDRRNMEYLYTTGDGFVFMDQETFEQVELTKDTLGDAMDYLVENMKIQVQFYEGNPVGIELPLNVALKVTYTEPAMKNATVTTSFKPATLETGLEVQVPPFITTGEVIKVDTRNGKYLERA